MKLFNVKVEANYNASYEGEIEKNYTVLVFAENEDSAIKFVNEGLIYTPNETADAKTAFEVDSNKAKNKRKASFYVA